MVEKFRTILSLIEIQYGAVNIFAIMKMDDLFNVWSVVISASWINETNRRDVFGFIVSLLRNNLDAEEKDTIARVGIFDYNEHLIQELLNVPLNSSGEAEINDQRINGNKVHKSHILRSRRQE